MPSTQGYPTYWPYALLAGAEAAKGNDAEAKLALAEARRLNPQLTIKSFAETMPAEPIVIDGFAQGLGFRKNKRPTVFWLNKAMRQRRTQPM